MNIMFFMAARQRLIYEGQQTLAGALLGRSDNDSAIQAIEQLFELQKGDDVRSPAHAVELAVAEMVDNGAPLPVTNPEGYAAAQWLSGINLANLPDPIPRAFVLYIAKAYTDRGEYPTLVAALTDIFNTRTFI